MTTISCTDAIRQVVKKTVVAAVETVTQPTDMTNNAVRKFTRQLPVSEIFYSIEGEGIMTGFPTMFVRTFGCNFTCSGFSATEPPAVEEARKQIIKINTLDDFKPYESGCDSIYAWNSEYAHLMNKLGCDKLVEEILGKMPSGQWKLPNGATPILSLTGGEPTLQQKFLEQFLYHPFMDKVGKLLIETNAAVPLSKTFLLSLTDWHHRTNGLLMWANSPKLSISGEPWDKAIRPNIICDQFSVPGAVQYFKFVSDGTQESIAEVNRAMSEYTTALQKIGGSTNELSVLLMPVGGKLEQQQEMHQRVARACLDNGYIFSARVHVYVYGNTAGT